MEGKNRLRGGTLLLVAGGVESFDEFSPDVDENDFCEFSGVSQFLVWCCRGGVALTYTRVAMQSPSRGGLQHPPMLRLPLKAPLYPPKAYPSGEPRLARPLSERC